MKKIIFLTMIVIASVSFAQDNSLTQVSYTNPEKFTDFETRHGLRDRLGRLKKDLSRNINKLWKKTIINGNSLTINFTDIDMAGRIMYGIDQVREVRVDSDKSVLEFDFIIKSKDGKIIKSGHERLVNKNLARLNRYSKKYNRTILKYEFALFAKWVGNLSKDIS